MFFSWLDQDCAFGEEYHSGDGNLDHFVAAVSARFLNCNLTGFPFPYAV